MNAGRGTQNINLSRITSSPTNNMGGFSNAIKEWSQSLFNKVLRRRAGILGNGVEIKFVN